MEEARQAVESHLARAGHHDTTVHEKVAPAVTRETITRTEHEEVTTAVDQEIHQDHYHVSVQPITEEEYREEQHHHVISPVEQENFEHDDPAEVQSVLAEVAAQFKNEINNVTAEKTTSTLPNIEGVSMHHHCYETIQPVITKQTFEPHVYHVIRRRQEVHHNRAIHHAPSTLPALTLAEFLKNGGVLNGREERYDAFEGEPRLIGGESSSNPPVASDATAVPAPEAPVRSKTAGTTAEAQPTQLDRTSTIKSAAAGPAPTTEDFAAAPSRIATRAGREPTAFGSLDRVLSDAGLKRAPTAGIQRTPTAPLERVPTVRFERAPTALTRTPTAPLSRAPTAATPATPLEPAPTAPIERAPTAPTTPASPGISPTPTGLATRTPPPESAPEPSPPVRIGTASASTHPLMNPGTSLPQHVYRGGHGAVPRHRRPRTPGAATSHAAPEQSGTNLTDKPTEEP